MTARYERFGIHFLYPENWELQDDLSADWPKEVSVHARSGAFWSVTVYETPEPPAQICEQAIEAMRGEYEDLEVYPLEMELHGIAVQGFELQFYCLDFLVQGRMLSCRHGGRTILLAWQAEDRDFEQLAPVFCAISTSLLVNGIGH